MRLTILNNPSVLKSAMKRIEKYTVKTVGCWSWTGHRNYHGYPILVIGGRIGYHERVSRILLYLKHSITDSSLCACHTCDNPSCVNPEHLFWGTKKDNIKDMLRKGRGSKPPINTRDKTSRCAIKTSDIPQIAELSQSHSIRELAEMYGVHYETMCRLLVANNIKAVNMRGVGCRPPRQPSKFEEPEMEMEVFAVE